MLTVKRNKNVELPRNENAMVIKEVSKRRAVFGTSIDWKMLMV
jgi:hypothetical protein